MAFFFRTAQDGTSSFFLCCEFRPQLSFRSDNDQYSHMNNAIYYHLFDSIVNAYLSEHCGLSPISSSHIGLVVSSFCEASFGITSFLQLAKAIPAVLLAGGVSPDARSRVNRIEARQELCYV